MQLPKQPPEAKLIEDLRQASRPKLSVRKAAQAAGISEGRWRQIGKGYNQISKDTVVASIAPADTLARMARVVGATPEQLIEVGRADAADELVRQMTVREKYLYEKAGGQVRPRTAGLGSGLASLIPIEEPAPAEQDEQDEIEGLRQVLAQTWRQAHDLAREVTALNDAPEGLRDVARRIVFTLSAYLIIRILSSGYAAEMEPWLRRIYVERERLYRDVTVGEPIFPWLTEEEIAQEEKENSRVVEATPQSDASGEAGEGQEAGSPHDAKSRSDALGRWGRGGKVEDGNESA